MIEQIKKKLLQHHMLYRYPVKAELWEDIFDQIINPKSKTWNMGSHSTGADVVCGTTGIRYQNKSGTIKNNILRWSGHRTTKHETLEEKIQFISSDHCDQYVMLARDSKEWSCGIMKYYFITFDASIIDYTRLTWTPTLNRKKTKVTGWKGNTDNYEAKIIRGASDQLWTWANLSYLGNIHPIIIEYDT
jgi:hypothetical protein